MTRLRLLPASCALAASLAAQEAPTAVLHGVRLVTPDVAASVRFYSEGLAFDVTETTRRRAVLHHGELRLELVRGRVPQRKPRTATLSINMQVARLGAAVERVRAAGALIDDPEPRAFVLGHAVDVLDPAGHAVHLLTLNARPLPADAEPRVFNLGATAPDLAIVEPWYRRLGFTVFSRDYLPQTLPMNQNGAAALVFHAGEVEAKTPAWSAAGLLLSTEDLAQTRAHLKGGDFEIESAEATDAEQPALRLRDPAGLPVWVIEREPSAEPRNPKKEGPPIQLTRAQSSSG